MVDEKKNKKEKKKKPEPTETPIRLAGGWFEKLRENHPDFAVLTALFKRLDWPPFVRWWLGRVMDLIEREAKIYFEQRQDYMDEYSEKWEEDGSFESAVPTRVPYTNDDGKEAFKIEYQTVDYKEGDIKVKPNGQIDWGDKERETAFNEKIKELTEREVTLKLWKIAMDVSDLPKEIPPEELKLLVDIIEIPDVDTQIEIPDDEFEKLVNKGDPEPEGEEIEDEEAEDNDE